LKTEDALRENINHIAGGYIVGEEGRKPIEEIRQELNKTKLAYNVKEEIVQIVTKVRSNVNDSMEKKHGKGWNRW
jgi:hypothetical protein